MILAGEGAINVIDQFDELEFFAVARVRQVDSELSMDVGRVAAQDDDAIGEKNSFLDVVGDDEDGARRDFFTEPQFK